MCLCKQIHTHIHADTDVCFYMSIFSKPPLLRTHVDLKSCLDMYKPWKSVWKFEPLSLNPDSNPSWSMAPIPWNDTEYLYLRYSYTQRHGSSMFESPSLWVPKGRRKYLCGLTSPSHALPPGPNVTRGVLWWCYRMVGSGRKTRGGRWEEVTGTHFLYSFKCILICSGWLRLIGYGPLPFSTPLPVSWFSPPRWFGARLLPFSLDLTNVFF